MTDEMSVNFQEIREIMYQHHFTGYENEKTKSCEFRKGIIKLSNSKSFEFKSS